MKYLVSYLLVLLLITSCIPQDPYYEQEQYQAAPSIEIQRSYPHYYYHNNNRYYRAAPPSQRYYYSYPEVNRNRPIINSPHAHSPVYVHPEGNRFTNRSEYGPGPAVYTHDNVEAPEQALLFSNPGPSVVYGHP